MVWANDLDLVVDPVVAHAGIIVAVAMVLARPGQEVLVGCWPALFAGRAARLAQHMIVGLLPERAMVWTNDLDLRCAVFIFNPPVIVAVTVNRNRSLYKVSRGESS